jgi:hypothetical protein
MNTPSAVSTGLGCLLLCAGAVSVVPGCADTAPFPETDGPGLTDPSPTALPDGAKVINEYVLQVRPGQRTAKLLHLKPGVSSRPGFTPQSVDDINVIQDNTPGSGPAGSVELVTNTVSFGTACPSNIATSFCANVTLGSFYTRPLNNVFVQVTSITDANGVDLSGHGGINSDAAPSWLPDSGLGLWKHTATKATTAGVIGTAPDNFGTRDWEFADPDGQATNIVLRVVATLSYKDYTRTALTQSFFNSCTATTNDGTPSTSDTPVTLPFPFTFYGVQGTTASIYNRDGVVAFGGASPPPGDNVSFQNVILPENTATPHISTSPGVYVFWDKLNYNNTATALCHGTLGTAPNRQFIYTWRNLKGYNNNANTMNVSFNVIISEGTDTIDMVYGTMSGTPANDKTYPTITNAQRAAGKKAIVGLQGPNGSVNIATPAIAALGSTVTSTNTAWRYTPVP